MCFSFCLSSIHLPKVDSFCKTQNQNHFPQEDFLDNWEPKSLFTLSFYSTLPGLKKIKK